MTRDLWINLPVRDVEAAKAFYTALGFTYNPRPGDTGISACILVGSRPVVVMLFASHVFESFTRHPLADTAAGTSVLISVDAESREEVDALAAQAVAAGGTLFGKPAEVPGGMYGCGFTDLDGHRWNVLFMGRFPA